LGRQVVRHAGPPGALLVADDVTLDRAVLGRPVALPALATRYVPGHVGLTSGNDFQCSRSRLRAAGRGRTMPRERTGRRATATSLPGGAPMLRSRPLLLPALCLLAALARAEDPPARSGIPDYRPVAGWPRLPADLKLGSVSAVATDSADRVYVFHRGKQPILVFDRDGKLLRSWGDDLVGNAHGLRLAHDGNVWATDIGNHLVMKFDPAGKLLLTLGTKGKAGDTPELFNKPTDVAVAPTGEFYVSDGY